MGKGHRSQSHRVFKDKAKTRVDDLQGMFSDLQSARNESRAADAAVLEEQVHQMLREWKAELNEPSPANSLVVNSGASTELEPPSPSEILRMLQLDEEDDATSKLVEQAAGNPKSEPEEVDQLGVLGVRGDVGTAVFHETYFLTQENAGDAFLYADQYKDNPPTGINQTTLDHLEGNTHLGYQQFNLQQELPQNICTGISGADQSCIDEFPHMSDLLPTICPPPSAFLRSKCALWDCPRPAQGSEWFQDYCSNFHATLALNEGPPGMTPVLRPGGINLKDGPLFAALSAKVHGKNVGIPVCEGAATSKSPWNAPELFDLSVLDCESIREWLFFDKPRRAFESGNRKQRSLPDYCGRGWHESRKQVMKELGGLKRSYYMDPQPLTPFEWHLYEYEIDDCDALALYRLEFKLGDAKKTSKSKNAGSSLADLQQHMVRLNADGTVDNKRNARNRAKAVQKHTPENIYSASNMVDHKGNVSDPYYALDLMNQITFSDDNPVYGPSLPYDYTTERTNYNGT